MYHTAKNFHRTIFRPSSYPLHYRNILWNKFFVHMVKITIGSMIVIINMGQKICRAKILLEGKLTAITTVILLPHFLSSWSSLYTIFSCSLNRWSVRVGISCTQLCQTHAPHFSVYHPFPFGVYFNCFGNESSLADCHATGMLLCNSDYIAGVQRAGEMVAGIFSEWL